MTSTSTTTRPTARDMTGKMMADAAKRMLPVIAGKLLTAAADRAVEGIEGLADRLQELGAPAEDAEAPRGQDADADPAGESGGRMGAAYAFVVEQARIVLQFLARLAAQAAEMLRRATARLRARRAPEGIDEAPAPEEISAPEDLDDVDDRDDDEFEDDEVAADEVEADDERAPVGV